MRKSGSPIVATLGLLAALPLAALARDSSIERRVNAEADGHVVITNVSGMIDVRGWDRNEVQVSGHVDEDVERVDVESDGRRTVVKVVLPRNSHDGDAVLEIQVPRASSVEVTAVSADISSRGVLGTQRLKTVSGEVTAEVSATDSELRSVSGDITVRGSGKPMGLRVSSVSGNLDLSNAAGRLDLVTVSGDARLQMGEVTELNARTTSGSLELRGRLSGDGRVNVESVSGDVTLRVGPGTGLSTEIESFSGDIHGCLAKDVERVSKYGPGTRLMIRSVESGPRIRAKTLSGDIEICDR